MSLADCLRSAQRRGRRAEDVTNAPHANAASLVAGHTFHSAGRRLRNRDSLVPGGSHTGGEQALGRAIRVRARDLLK